MAVAYGLGLLLSLVNMGPWGEPEARGIAWATLGCAAVVVIGTGLVFVLSFDVTEHLDMLGSILDAVLWFFGFPYLLGAGLSEVADGAIEAAVGRRALGAARLRPIAHMTQRERPGGSVEERLRELQGLLDQGLIKPEDYEQRKQSILEEV